MQKPEDDEKFTDEMRRRQGDGHGNTVRVIKWKMPAILSNKTCYGQCIGRFYFVYQALEEILLEHRDHEHVKPVLDNFGEGLFRTKAFEEDLSFYLGKFWRSQVQKTDPVKIYIKRMKEVAETNPSLLVAYMHACYAALGNGGQEIKKVVVKLLGLPNDKEGCAIFDYDFGSETLKKGLNETIDSLDLTREQKELIILEKYRSFRMNNTLVNDVDVSWYSFARVFKFLIGGAVVTAAAGYCIYRAKDMISIRSNDVGV